MAVSCSGICQYLRISLDTEKPICCMVVINPKIPFAFQRQGHSAMFRKSSIHLVERLDKVSPVM